MFQCVNDQCAMNLVDARSSDAIIENPCHRSSVTQLKIRCHSSTAQQGKGPPGAPWIPRPTLTLFSVRSFAPILPFSSFSAFGRCLVTPIVNY